MLEITGAQAVLYRLINEPILLEPLTGALVQRGDIPRARLPQPLAQQIGKEMVIPVPAPLFIQRNDKQISAFKQLQSLLPVPPACEGIA